MINFIKISEYETKPSDKDVFGYLCDVVSQKIDPPTLKPRSLRSDASIVFHSPLRRAVECLELKGGVRYIPTPSLREIPFDMRLMCSKEEWVFGGSNLIRHKFKEFFVANRLGSSREDIIRETRNFLARCYVLSRLSEITVVSHSFRLKVIEAFIKSQGSLSKDPFLIYEYIKDDEKTFCFESGFSVAENSLAFSICS